MKCDICQINEADNQTPKGEYFCSHCENKFMAAMDDVNNIDDFIAAMSDKKNK